MKRLQIRHHEDIFDSRASAKQYFADIVDPNKVLSTQFGSTLYSEPVVAKYLDESGRTQVVLAIGTEDGQSPFHIIDSADILERIERATEEEEKLQEQITNNISKIESVSPSAANVLEEYALRNALGEQMGETVKVYRDSKFIGAAFGFKGAKGVSVSPDGDITLEYDEAQRDETAETIYFVYTDEYGEYVLFPVNLEQVILESEIGNGLQVDDHVLSVKVADGERYIRVNEDGISSNGINETISSEIEKLSEELTAKIDGEIARSTEADVYISGVVSSVRATVVSEIERLDEVSAAATEYYNKAIHAVNTAYSASIAYADQKFSDSKAYTDTSVGSVTGAIESLTNTLNGSIANVNNALNAETQNRETADKDILSKIFGEISARTDGDANLLAMINKEIADRTEGDSEERKYADEKIAALEERVKTLEDICDNLIDFGTYRME